LTHSQTKIQLTTPFDKIGKVTNTSISDGTTNLPCQAIDLGKVKLIKVNEVIYLDDVVSLKLLTYEDVLEHNLRDYFEVEEVKVSSVKRSKKR